jgi:hypothetical protein
MNTTNIGWCFDRDTGVGIYQAPIPVLKLLRSQRVDAGVGSCPAAIDFNIRTYTVLSPYTFRLRAVKQQDESYSFHIVYPETHVSESVLKNELSFQPRSLWRDGRFPVLQLVLPYIFIANESVYINQIEPSRFNECKPWSLIEGRFDISTWHRPVNWAIEWLDTSKDIVIKRGDPLFQVLFETTNPKNKIKLKHVERTSVIEKSVKKVEGISSKMKGTKKIIYDEANRLNIGELNEEN